TNPELARISTLTDLTNGKENDPSDNIMRAYYPILKDAFAATRNEQELKVILQAIISTMQVTFLRQVVNKKVSGFDFFDEVQRNEFIDTLVDLFCN
ncbi:MAG TPA: hypothetical protein VNU93_07020, partial [Verrucomicrobiae bacterium]|nr:hypothetical protein [Verrucomicrobiae bacterium]